MKTHVVIMVAALAPAAVLAGGGPPPGLDELYSQARQRDLELVRRSEAISKAEPPPGGADPAWRQRWLDERRRLAELRDRNARLLEQYGRYVRPAPPVLVKPPMVMPVPPPAPPIQDHRPPPWLQGPPPVPPRQGGSATSFFKGLGADIFGQGFDWRRWLAFGGGAALGYFVGNLVMGPRGGLIGAVVGAIGIERLVGWLLDRSKHKAPEVWVRAPPRERPPLPPPGWQGPPPANLLEARQRLDAGYLRMEDMIKTGRPSAELSEAYGSYRGSYGHYEMLRKPIYLRQGPVAP